ncbi:outer membrane lipoprotein SlyB [Sphingomonas sp. SORGH_AS 950]|uniref:glycine zipper 2TM domain-containing protein n=1 Tax=unclassified Sphingomonas TaxID=196159 RepID=UPI00278AE847|nr:MULTISPECIES: glycine zipper 2TM domain-containing protein [unclassified Sphingomonas]MDQ1158098.1 outer membrane lipoprotein SlyB [Sphingomonas sp. SORGH_AS_0950]MDR6114018.1 outer membrane lipoprotein SlyB [Sphingomonas sp. SORGH_AS_0789]MDR6144793.1 outer membrane lipoprotein SlyB [Sphingomonas sp. SORGH_AS_0870]MDR6148622.1 outer membrane lipoprotein SlyB [Sphingomonas sp. SORGH_AS_0742]
MMKTLTLAATTLAMLGGAVLPATAADAHRYRRAYHADRYDRGYEDGARAEYQARKCRRSGTTGTIVGAVAGGLLGRTIDTDGDRTLGTLIGGGAGALAGRAIERSGRPGYCR